MPPIRCSSEPVWWLTTDQDLGLLELHARHYSKREYADGREVFQCLGPGEKVPLRTHGDQWAYDVIDLSARGPRRGLLVAAESIHETHDAPACPKRS
jgi:hypothetical protein